MSRLEEICYRRPFRSVYGKHVSITYSELEFLLSEGDPVSVRKREWHVQP